MKLSKLIAELKVDYPAIRFQSSDIAHWSPSEQTIYYDSSATNTIHELGHALLGHSTFTQDIELIRIERDAWEKAEHIAKKYRVVINDKIVEAAMDNYREWLHSRSSCPKCYQVGVQSHRNLSYYCINCSAKWKANDARSCGLKRTIITSKNRP